MSQLRNLESAVRERNQLLALNNPIGLVTVEGNFFPRREPGRHYPHKGRDVDRRSRQNGSPGSRGEDWEFFTGPILGASLITQLSAYISMYTGAWGLIFGGLLIPYLTISREGISARSNPLRVSAISLEEIFNRAF